MDLITLVFFRSIFELYPLSFFFFSNLAILKHVLILTQIRNPPYLARNLSQCLPRTKAKLTPWPDFPRHAPQ